jgi:hypothetical protein
MRFSVCVSHGSTLDPKTTLTDDALGAKAAAEAGKSCGGILSLSFEPPPQALWDKRERQGKRKVWRGKEHGWSTVERLRKRVVERETNNKEETR